VTDFAFKEERNLGVFSCRRVAKDGAPVLHVSHEEDGDWQFLCGGTHEEGGGDEALLVCLEHVVEKDPSLNELADLCPHWQAFRDEPGGKWRREDGLEDIVRANVEEYGSHVMSVSADDEGPGFSYTIGLWQTQKAPEIICVGLPSKSAHAILNHVRDLVRDGAHLADGDERTDVLDGFTCRFRRLSVRHYRNYMGYANWFNEGHDYPVLQLVYPDREGRFPEDSGVSEAFLKQQTRLWE
jgi:hypothetical protein